MKVPIDKGFEKASDTQKIMLHYSKKFNIFYLS